MYYIDKYNFFAKGMANSSIFTLMLMIVFSCGVNAEQYQPYESADSYYIPPKSGHGTVYKSNTQYNIVSLNSDNEISNQLNNLSEQILVEIQNEIEHKYQDNDNAYQEYRGDYTPPEYGIFGDNVEYQDNDAVYKEYRSNTGTYSDENGYVSAPNKQYDTYYNDTIGGSYDDSGYGQDNDANYNGSDRFHNWKGDGADNDGDWYPMHFYY